MTSMLLVPLGLVKVTGIGVEGLESCIRSLMTVMFPVTLLLKVRVVPPEALPVIVEGEPAEPRVRVWPAPRLLAMVRPVAVVKEIGPVRVRLLVSPVALETVNPPPPIWIGLASVRV